MGERDVDGRDVRVTTICAVDEIAGASEIVMDKVGAVPPAIACVYDYECGEGSSAEIVRVQEFGLFSRAPVGRSR